MHKQQSIKNCYKLNQIKKRLKNDEFSGGTSGGRSGTKNITLNKSSGYRANGTFEVYGYFTYTTCSVEVISASAYGYLD